MLGDLIIVPIAIICLAFIGYIIGKLKGIVAKCESCGKDMYKNEQAHYKTATHYNNVDSFRLDMIDGTKKRGKAIVTVYCTKCFQNIENKMENK